MVEANPSLLTGLFGAALCLFGFVLYWGGLKMLGFFLGGSVGLLVGTIIAYVADLESTVTLAVIVIGLIVGAALGWRFIKTLQRVIVFLIGLGLGFLVGKYVLPGFGEAWTEPWVSLAAPFVGGILSLLLFRYIIILVTVSIGSYLLYQATGQPWVSSLAFAIGLLVQIGAFHGLGLDKKAEEREKD